jgi:4-amino-4-deoxyprephenate dehydrogenase
MRIDSRDSALVLGAAGGFGRLFTTMLGDDVLGVDLAGDRRGDATDPDEQTLSLVRRARCVVLCLPEAAALKAIDRLLSELAPGALLVDTLSVKTPVADRINRDDVEVLSLNPLFAPDLGFRGQNVAAVEIRPGPRSRALVAQLEGAGATVVTVTADEHDRRAALAQVAPHAALLAYGRCLVAADHDRAFSTPPQRALLALLARVVTQDPEVYRRIQVDNPHAREARAALAGALQQVGAATADPASFEALFASIRQALEPALGDLAARSRRLLGS